MELRLRLQLWCLLSGMLVTMDPGETALSQQIRCDGCRQSAPSYDIVHYGSIERGYRRLCSQCFNGEAAKAAGLEGFEHAKFELVGLTDCAGEIHEFHFRTNLFGPGVALDAFELRDGSPAGYHFQIIGGPADDLLVLLGRLIAKIRRALSVKHLVDGELGLQIGDSRVVQGMVASDRDYGGRTPLLIIDGREVTWDEVGRLLMSFEGWQFKLNLADKSEEI
jgi:hypothetical protein